MAEEMGKEEDEDDIAEIFGDFEESGKDDHKEVVPAEVDAETNRARGLRQPGQPSRKEIEEHNLTHGSSGTGVKFVCTAEDAGTNTGGQRWTRKRMSAR